MIDAETIISDAKAKLASGEKLGVEDALNLLRVQVQKKGEDYVYVNADGVLANPSGDTACENVHFSSQDEATPGCIVGHVLWDLTDHYGEIPVGGDSDDYYTRQRFTGEARGHLSTAQANQDIGKTWGEALREAEKFIPDEDDE